MRNLSWGLQICLCTSGTLPSWGFFTHACLFSLQSSVFIPNGSLPSSCENNSSFLPRTCSTLTILASTKSSSLRPDSKVQGSLLLQLSVSDENSDSPALWWKPSSHLACGRLRSIPSLLPKRLMKYGPSPMVLTQRRSIATQGHT